MRLRLTIPRRTRSAIVWLALVVAPEMIHAQDAEGHFQSAPTTSESIRADAKSAPLAMRFDGSTPDDLADWQKRFGSRLKSLLGPHSPPKRWETVVEQREEFDDFVRERLVLKVEGHPDLPLYRLLPHPLPEKPCPGAVAIHGHSGVFPVVGLREVEGKLEEAPPNHYDYGRDLAQRGYIVVAPCLTPFHPRESLDEYGTLEDRCATTFVRMQLLGKLLIAENLRDCLWCIETLAQDERVDAKRLGCLGLSYGGRMAMLTTAIEPRIRVAAISGAANVMQERIRLKYRCGAQVIPGLLQYGDVPEIGSLIAPRPCVWEIGSRDGLIDPNWANEAMQRIERAYRAAGKADQLYVDRFEGGHNFHGKVAYPLFDKVLRPGE